MANIYNSLNNVYLKVKNEVLNNTLVTLLTLVFLTLPLPYIYNSIATIIFVAYCLYNLKFNEISINKTLLLPILLYVLMVLSLLWSISFKTTLDSLIKEIPLLIIPVCFGIISISKIQKDKINSNFGYIIFGYTVYYLIKAIIKYIIFKDSNVFFYHELVTLDVNAVHVSVYCALAFFVFLLKKNKKTIDKIALVVLVIFIFLLSSKNIIITFFLLSLVYLIFSQGRIIKKQQLFIGFFSLVLGSTLFFNKIKDRFLIEIESNTSSNSINQEFSSKGVVHNVTIYDAWNKKEFSGNDYFPGTAMRVYQIRIFTEMLQEDAIFFTGYGLNASWDKLKEKRIEHKLYEGYEKFNFHNQYIQNFAELGIVGILLLIVIVVLTLRNAIITKDFIHFSFAVLMISLFLTESFLWRQRGVIFFTLFYCLLNIKLDNNNTPIEYLKI